MSNGINKRQNEPDSISRIAAQKRLYTIIERMGSFNVALSVLVPLSLSIVQDFIAPDNLPRLLSYGLSILMLIPSLVFTNAIQKKKALAATIQLEFDTYVFQMPWDDRLFGKRKNHNQDIIIHSKKLLASESEKEKLKNWYSPYSDEMILENGILTCQRESLYWDGNLRKRYRNTISVFMALIIFGTIIFGIYKNEPVQKLMMRIAYIIPMARWYLGLVNELNNDICRLKEIESLIEPEEKSMTELQVVENKLTNHRRAAVKIPNWFYKIHKSDDEDTASRLIEFENKQK